MSTNISTAFDAIKAKLATLYPPGSGYYQLTNPYNIEENTDSAKELGWGIALGHGANTKRNLSNQMSLQRTIRIILTRRRYANELDTDSKESAEKSLLEDQFLLIRSLELEPAINNATSGITRFVYVGDDGIESVLADNDSYIKLSSEFELEYFESLL